MKFFERNLNGVKARLLSTRLLTLFIFLSFLTILTGCTNQSNTTPSASPEKNSNPSKESFPSAPGPNENSVSVSVGGEEPFEEMEVPPGHILPWTSWAIGALIRGLAPDGDNLWIGTTNGLIRFHKKNESYKVFTTKDGLMNNIIVSILVGPDGGKWIGTYGGGLQYYDDEQWRVFTPYGRGTTHYGPQWVSYSPGEGLGDLWVYSALFDPGGVLWVATWKGVSRFDGKVFKTLSTGDGMVDKWVYTINVDRDGSLWFGTEGGVNRYDGKNWDVWTHQDGLGAVESLIREEEKGAPQLPQGHHLQEGKGASGYNPNYIVSSVIDQKGIKWFGTWGGGLSRFDGKKWKNYTTQDGLAGNTVNAIALDPNGILWIGTNNGVSRYDGKNFKTFQTMDGLLSNSVFAVAIDEDGAKWFGTYGGVSRYTGP
jgi:ligand-binding sensor domain-containing protein